MKKEEFIQYWKDSSAEDLQRANLLFRNKDYLFALFCCHLSLEKILKAHWVKDHSENFPPKIHNLVYLISNTKLNPPEPELAFLEQMNLFQLEGRYPDYKNKIAKIYDRNKCKLIMSKVNTLIKWLIKNL